MFTNHKNLNVLDVKNILEVRMLNLVLRGIEEHPSDRSSRRVHVSTFGLCIFIILQFFYTIKNLVKQFRGYNSSKFNIL